MLNRMNLTINFKKIFSSFTLPPSAIIAGAQKAGTTSLFSYMCEHPQIARPLKKEIHFFDLQYSKGMSWYKAHFPFKKCGHISIEASPYYMFHPLALERAKLHYPDSNIIMLLRNPAERAFSHYKHNKKKGRELRSFNEAIKDEINDFKFADENAHRHYSYLHRGLYSGQITRAFNIFGKEQVYVISSENFYKNPQPILNSLYTSLGLPEYKNKDLTVKNEGISDSDKDSESTEIMRTFYKDELARIHDLLGKSFQWQI